MSFLVELNAPDSLRPLAEDVAKELSWEQKDDFTTFVVNSPGTEAADPAAVADVSVCFELADADGPTSVDSLSLQTSVDAPPSLSSGSSFEECTLGDGGPDDVEGGALVAVALTDQVVVTLNTHPGEDAVLVARVLKERFLTGLEQPQYVIQNEGSGAIPLVSDEDSSSNVGLNWGDAGSFAEQEAPGDECRDAIPEGWQRYVGPEFADSTIMMTGVVHEGTLVTTQSGRRGTEVLKKCVRVLQRRVPQLVVRHFRESGSGVVASKLCGVKPGVKHLLSGRFSPKMGVGEVPAAVVASHIERFVPSTVRMAKSEFGFESASLLSVLHCSCEALLADSVDQIMQLSQACHVVLVVPDTVAVPAGLKYVTTVVVDCGDVAEDLAKHVASVCLAVQKTPEDPREGSPSAT